MTEHDQHEKIREALLIALREPTFEDESDLRRMSPEIIAVFASADVTAFCRALDLLTGTQFIRYRPRGYPAPNPYPGNYAPEFSLLEPTAFDGDEVIGTEQQFRHCAQAERSPAIPTAPELREEFLRLSEDENHPLHQPPPPTHPVILKPPF